MTALVLTPSSCTNSGNNTASTSWAVSRPAQSTGDMIVCHLVSDANVTHGTLPGGPNGETAVTIINAQGDGAAGVVVSVWYWIATAAASSGTVTVTPSATEQWQATVVRIPYLQYDSATPVQYSNNYLAGSSAAIVCPTLVPGRNKQRPVFWAGIDADTVSGISQQAGTTWTLLANVDVGAITGVFAYRENQTSLSATVTSGNLTGASDNYVSVGYLINEVANISLTPVKATLTLTGKVPTVTQVIAPAGHFRSGPLLGLGGFGSPLSTGGSKTLEPAKGALSLTGKVATVAQTANRFLEPAKGSLSLAGHVPGVARTDNRSLQPVKGTLTLTGNVATVEQAANQTIAAIVGHLTATGYAPSVARTAHQSIGPPTTGTLSLTGQQATLSQPRSLTPTAGSLSLTGYTPTVAQAAPQAGFPSIALLGLYVGAATGSRTVAPAKGHLSLTGKVPVIGRSQSVTPTKGALTLTGKAPTVGNQAALIEWNDSGADEGYRVKWGLSTGTYSWSADVATNVLQYEIQSLTYATKYYVVVYALVGGVEQEASAEIMLTAGFGFEPQTGHLSLAGKIPTVARTSAAIITPSKGTLTLTGRIPTLAQPRSLTPTVGHLSLTGYAPDVDQSRLVAPFSGSLTLTGYAPSLTQPRSLAPVVGHLTLTGYTPSLTQSRLVEPTAGALTLTGYIPTVAQAAGQVLEPATGHLALTGYVPTVGLVGSIVVEPQTGNLRLRGYVPTIDGPNWPRNRGAGSPGGGKKPKRKVWVEPEDDGPEIEVETPADVPRAVKAVKRQAKAIAERAIKAREPIPELPQWVVHGDAPHVEELRRRIDDIRANFAYVYQLMLIEQRRREDEDEEDVFLLTL